MKWAEKKTFLLWAAQDEDEEEEEVEKLCGLINFKTSNLNQWLFLIDWNERNRKLGERRNKKKCENSVFPLAEVWTVFRDNILSG